MMSAIAISALVVVAIFLGVLMMARSKGATARPTLSPMRGNTRPVRAGLRGTGPGPRSAPMLKEGWL